MRTHVAEDMVIKSAPVDINIKDVVEWLNSFDEIYTRFSCEGESHDTAMVMFFCNSLTQLSIVCKELRNYGEIQAEFFQGSLRFCLRFHCAGCFAEFKENLATGITNDNCDYGIQRPISCNDNSQRDTADLLKDLEINEDLEDNEIKKHYVLNWYSNDGYQRFTGKEDVYLTKTFFRGIFDLPETHSAKGCYVVTATQRAKLNNLVETFIDLNTYEYQLDGYIEKSTPLETEKTWRNEDEFEFHDVINKGLNVKELTQLPITDEELDGSSRFQSVLNDVKAMTPEEFKVSLRKAGIIDDNDELMPQYKRKDIPKSSQIVQPVVKSVVPKDFIDASKECCNNPQLPQPPKGCKQIDLDAKNRGICMTGTNKHVIEMTDDF